MEIDELRGEYQALKRDCLGSTPFENDAQMCIAQKLGDIEFQLERIGDMLEILANRGAK
jgi:hypothetical protein